MRLKLIQQATIDFDAIAQKRSGESATAYPTFEVNEMLKHTLQHSDQEIRTVSNRIMDIIYGQRGYTGIEQLLNSLHPQVLQTFKGKFPEVELILKSGLANSQAELSGTSGAQGWPISLSNRISKSVATPSSQHSVAQSFNQNKRTTQSTVKNLSRVKKTPSALSQNSNDSKSGSRQQTRESNDDLEHIVNEDKRALQPVTCQFCDVSSIEFNDGEKMDLHYVLQCEMLTNCSACTQIIEVSSYNEHKLYQCDKKSDFKQCNRCKEAIDVDFYEQHIQSLTCAKATGMLRCPLCHKDLPNTQNFESEDKIWRHHLTVEKCAAANVRISTNAKARISILRAKQPPASEVIMEEDDEEDDQETVGGGGHSGTKPGRITAQSRRDSQIQDGESRKSASFKRGSLPGSPIGGK